MTFSRFSLADTNIDTNILNCLLASLSHWAKEKIRGVWFRVHLQNAEWVPILAKVSVI